MRDTHCTVAAWKAARDHVIEPAIADHSGRLIKLTDDGFLSESPSVQDAVTCAIVIQDELAQSPLAFQIGVHLGDVVDDGKDIHGEGVNIAAHIEALAHSGGICIFAAVHEQVRNRLQTTFEDLRDHTVKHVSAPVRIYRIARPAAGLDNDSSLVVPLVSDKPSIAILPFENLSADPEQQYFADGIVEELITELSRNKWLFVIFRGSTFTYKGRSIDVRRVGRELSGRYVLQGSVRKAQSRVQINRQLVDVSDGTHLWVDRIDGDVTDLFDLQDRVTESVVGSIAPKLESAEVERAKRKPTASLDAYDCYLRGLAGFHEDRKTGNEQTMAMFLKAIETDPNFTAAYGMAARTYTQRKGFGWIAHAEQDRTEAERLARIAAELGKDDAIALAAAGFSLVMFGEILDGDAYLRLALVANPNLAWAWHMSGFARVLLGQPESAAERSTRAMRLSPQDHQIFAMQTVAALGHYFCRRYEDAASWGETALRSRSDFLAAASVITASYAMSDCAGDIDKAMARVREIDPKLRCSNPTGRLPFHGEELELWARG